MLLMLFLGLAAARRLHDHSGQRSAQLIEMRLTSEEFKEKIDNNLLDVIVDVRTRGEWEQGRIPGATFLERLNRFNQSDQVATPSDLAGCEFCDIGVYCQSGNRAGTAIQILMANGFKGHLYNGLGYVRFAVSVARIHLLYSEYSVLVLTVNILAHFIHRVGDWVDAGFELVTDSESVVPPCTTDAAAQEQCRLNYLARTNPAAVSNITVSPTSAPSETPSSGVAGSWVALGALTVTSMLILLQW